MTENKTPKGMLICGWLAAVLLSIGTYFKLMHWPFASIMIILGTVFFVLFYLPLWLISSLKTGKMATIFKFVDPGNEGDIIRIKPLII